MNDISLPGNNRHIVDQLGQVRNTIKILKEREDDLKKQVGVMMGKSDSLGGDEWIARQSISSRKGSIDAKAMEKAGIDVEQFRKPDSIVITIRTEQRALEDA